MAMIENVIPLPRVMDQPPKRRFLVKVNPALIAKRNGDLVRVEPGLWAFHCPGGCVTMVRAKTSNAAANAGCDSKHPSHYAFRIGIGYVCRSRYGRREIKR